MPAPYAIAYVDPPWSYRNKRTGGSHTSGSAQKYQTLTLPELQALPVRTVMARDSILALWGTTPMGMDPYLLMQTWGFTYKTELYWIKTGRKGMGYWLRGEVEKLLIGIRGRVPAWRENHPNWIMTPVGDHSHKPQTARALLTSLTPDADRLELFATETPKGWDAYGLALSPDHDVRLPDFWSQLIRRMI